MLSSSENSALPLSGPLWLPGNKLEAFAVASSSPSERALAIDKAREELLGLLHDVPESGYELSLTDLIEQKTSTDGLASNEATLPEVELNRSSTGKEREKRDSRSTSSSSSKGVLLNVYMPMSFARSFSVSRSRRQTEHKLNLDGNKRDREPNSIGCWSAIWERRRGKSRRQQLEGTR